MDEEQKQNSFLRGITGFIISMVALVCMFFGGLPLLLLLLCVIIMATGEYAQILKYKGFHPSFSVMAAVGILICLITGINRLDLIPAILVFGTIASFLTVLFMGRQPYIANVATTELGFMYGAILPCHIILIRRIELDPSISSAFLYRPFLEGEGFHLVMFVFLSILATDIFAYYIGKRHGKHKLAAVISPKKTIEGALGGGLFAIGVSMLGVLYTKLTLLECIIGGLLITTSAQLGDLSESLIKRDAGVKDSSNILPGHGGFLDRCDSYVFALPVAYFYFVGFTHGNNFIKDFITSLLNVTF